MPSAAEGFLLCIVTVESVLGIVGNGFMALVNSIDCVRRKKFSDISVLLTGLGISRICLIGAIISDGYIKICFFHMYASDAYVTSHGYLWVVINYLSIWFTTSLNLFYFLKIANFSHWAFLYWKRRINTILILLLGLLLILWSAAFPQMAKMLYEKRHHRNTSWSVYFLKQEFIINHVFLNLGALLFFLIAVVTCFLLIFSLYRHNKRMHSNASRFRDLNTEAHVRAVKILMSSIILFILYFMGIVIETICYYRPESMLLFILGMLSATIYPCSHSFILILTNNRLKQTSLRVLKKLKC